MAAEKTKPAKEAAEKSAPKKIKARKKDKKNVAFGHAYIKSTFNNTIVSITDPAGGVIAWSSSGQVDLKVLVNQLHLLRKWRPRLLLAKHRSMV